jgi:hypothetical protein
LRGRAAKAANPNEQYFSGFEFFLTGFTHWLQH